MTTRPSSHNPVRFSRWHPLADAVLPAGLPTVVQCRKASGLLDYKTGKSAMVWYGAGESNDALDLARRALADLDGPFVVRFRPASAATDELNELLRRFRLRFGALPIGNQDPMP